MCRQIVMDNYEFVCGDSGVVLGPAVDGHDILAPSPTGVQRLDAVREIFETYMVPKRREEEDEEFYRLVRAQTRVRGADPLARFKEVVNAASAKFNLPRDVVEDARMLFVKVIRTRKILTEDIVTRYAIASVFYVIKRRGLPVPLRDLIRLFSARRGGDLGIVRALWDIQRIAGKARQDYAPYLLKLATIAKLKCPGKIIEDASRIAEEMKKVKSFKPSVLAIASFLAACEINGMRPGVPKAALERAVGVSGCRDALRIARDVAYKV